MSDTLTRRSFLQSSAAALAASQAAAALGQTPAAAPRGPMVVASRNGLPALDKAMQMLRAGGDPLDAVVAAVNIVEDDPNDHSVGLGGLPNEEGVVELDASVMHGPTHKTGAVAALRNIRNPSCVARLVLQRTDHALLVGEGALRFARAHGFREENLLTEEARKIWLEWKESHSTNDAWLPPASQPASQKNAAARHAWQRTYGTINCLGLDAHGNLAGVTTTSGLSYKIPGRVGDSPIIGAGLYVDNAVGAAGSTGRGEANIQNCSSFFIVEQLRQGKSPIDACLEALKRVADHAEPRLRDERGRPVFDLKFYALTKDGRFGGAAMYSGGHFAVHDGEKARPVELAYLFKKQPG